MLNDIDSTCAEKYFLKLGGNKYMKTHFQKNRQVKIFNCRISNIRDLKVWRFVETDSKAGRK